MENKMDKRDNFQIVKDMISPILQKNIYIMLKNYV
jgi:hypothetical protein